MTVSAVPSFNLYLIKEFLDAQLCHSLLNELSNSTESAATVYGVSDSGSVDNTVRRTIRVMPSPTTLELVIQRLLAARAEIGTHFGINLERCEEPQFLRYRVGDFFVAHQDGNTGLMFSERERFRKVSAIVFLNPQSEVDEPGSFSGGSLVFTEWRHGRTPGQFTLPVEPGTLVTFPSETTHEVTLVTSGERYSIVSWYG